MPSRHSGDLLLADWAETTLFLPKVEQPPPMLQVLLHFEVQALLEVGFPRRVVGIRLRSDLDIPLNPGLGCHRQLNEMRSLRVCHLSTEDPVLVASAVKVFGFDPSGSFVGVSAFGPAPQQREDVILDFLEGSLAC